MWLLHLLPDSFIIFIVYLLIAGGLVGIIVGFLLDKFPLKIISAIVFCVGIYWYGGYSTEMAWRERVAEMEAKVKAAEEKSQEVNAEIDNKVTQNTKNIREKGKKQVEYITRLLEGKTVEIVKDMSAEERAAFEAKQKELLDAVKNCPVPKIIVEEQNKAASK